jgi:DNA-binding MarR family transcriptional regulator
MPARRTATPATPVAPGETPARQLAELVFQLGRLAYGDAGGGGLTPAQWAALRFFARANRFSRTVSAFAEFHATTRGTASQTVKALVTRGCLRRSPSDRDRRSVRFDLTPAGRRWLRRDPLEALVRAAGGLDAVERDQASAGLRRLLGGLAAERQRRAPGRCALCGHLGRGGEGFVCGLLREPLVAAELDELCIRFEGVGAGLPAPVAG